MSGICRWHEQSGWDACSTASNHTLDVGQRGVNATIRALDRAGLRHTGSYRSKAASRRPTILEAKGVKVAFLAYTALTKEGRSFSGLLASETAGSITLKGQEGKQQVEAPSRAAQVAR